MQGSVTKVATEMKAKGKSVISEDLADEIHNKKLPSQSGPIPSKGEEALSRNVSDYQNKRTNTTSKEEASKVRDASKRFGQDVVECRIEVWWPLDEMFYEGKQTYFF